MLRRWNHGGSQATRVVGMPLLGLIAIAAPAATPPNPGTAPSASAPPSTAYPVVWSSVLQLASQAAIAGRLTRGATGDPEYAEYDVVCRPGNGTRCADTAGVQSRTCKEFWARRQQGYGAENVQLLGRLLDVGARCRALETIAAAVPARRSALRDVRLAPAVVGVLPPVLGLAVTDGDSLALWAAARRGQSWRGTQPAVRARLDLSVRGDTVLRVVDKRQEVLVSFVARGDFDGDGWDDLLVRSVAGARGGSFTTDEVYILTRRTPDGPLLVVRRVW